MQGEAESHAEEDKSKRELVDALNQADQAIYSTENTLKEHGDKVSEEEKANIDQALEKLKKAKEGSNVDEIKKAIEELQTASHKLAQAMYEASAQKGQAAGAGADAGAATEGSETEGKDSKKGKEGGDVIDADYEVKE
jgi:molecular chaperone DnaK